MISPSFPAEQPEEVLEILNTVLDSHELVQTSGVKQIGLKGRHEGSRNCRSFVGIVDFGQSLGSLLLGHTLKRRRWASSSISIRE